MYQSFQTPTLNRVDGPDGRFYYDPDGNAYPSVTTVLSRTSTKDLSRWRKRVGEAEANRQLEMAQYRGTALHELVERYLNREDIDFTKLSPLIMSYFYPIRKFVDRRISEVYLTEKSFISKKLKVAGTIDAIVKIDGRWAVMDLKTSFNKFKQKYIGDYYLQASAYVVMAIENFDMDIDSFFIVGGSENSNVPEVFSGKAAHYLKEFYRRRQAFDSRTKDH